MLCCALVIVTACAVESVIAQSGRILVRDCSRRVSVWTAREEPVCDYWEIGWYRNGKVWGSETGKTREAVLRKVAVFSRSNDPDYADPGPPICVACLNQAPRGVSEDNALLLLQELEQKIEDALQEVAEAIADEARGKAPNKRPAFGQVFADYKRALEDALNRAREVMRLRSPIARVTENVANMIRNAEQDLERSLNQVGMAARALPVSAQAFLQSKDAEHDYRGRGQTLLNEGKNTEAIAIISEGIRKNPRSATALTFNNLGLAYHRSGHYVEAVPAYQEAIRMQPNFPTAYYNLGSTYIMLGRNEEAVRAELAAINLKPDLAEAWNQLGLAYLNLGRSHDAVAAFNRTVGLIPHVDVPHFNLALAYLKQGNQEAARQQYNILKRMGSKMASDLYDQINRTNNKRTDDVPYVLMPSPPKPKPE